MTRLTRTTIAAALAFACLPASIAGAASSSMRQNHCSEISGSIGSPERWLCPTE